MHQLVEIAPAATVEGLRAKSFAAMYECLPGVTDHVGGDFGEYDRPVEMLFRACVSVIGLSELVDRLETCLRKDET